MDFACVPGFPRRHISSQFMWWCEHFDDVDGGRRGATTRVWHDNGRANQDGSMPRTIMLQHVIEHDIHRQQPITS